MAHDISIRQTNTPLNIVRELNYLLSTVADPVNRSNYSYYSSRSLQPPISENFILEYLDMLHPRYMSNVKYEQSIKAYSKQLYTKVLQHFVDYCTKVVPVAEDITTNTEPFALTRSLQTGWKGEQVHIISNRSYVDMPGCYITYLNNEDIDMPFVLATTVPARRRTITISYSQQEVKDTEEPHMLLVSSILTFELNFLAHPHKYKRILCNSTPSTSP